MTFERITVDPEVMGGVACIAGTRIPVDTIVSLVADNHRAKEILAMYPQLQAGDVSEALQFAAVLREDVPGPRPM